jgi:hypothetical protein
MMAYFALWLDVNLWVALTLVKFLAHFLFFVAEV